MPLHSELLFRGTEPWLAWTAKNRGATALTYGMVVSIWNKTAGDSTADQDTLWCRAVSAGDAALYASQGSTNLSAKVLGLVLNTTSVAQLGEAVVCWGGVVHGAQITGAVSVESLLKLGSTKGKLAAGSGSDIGDYVIVAAAMSAASGGTVTAFVPPWRI